METRYVIITARNEYYFKSKEEMIEALLKLTSKSLTAITWSEVKS